MGFKSIEYWGIATTLFTHDHNSKRNLKSIVKRVFRDAIEFTFFRDGQASSLFLQKIIEALQELKNEINKN